MSFPKRSKHSASNQLEQDMLSKLPDKVLVHILSFLPTIDAVRTVCIRRFRNLWTKIHTLDFDDCDFIFDVEDDRYEKHLCLRFFHFINNVLRSHQGHKIHKFRLFWRTFYPDLEKWNVAKRMETWVRQLKRKQVEVLDLSFSLTDPRRRNFNLPHEIFTATSLVELSLENCEVKFLGVNMECLKILRLAKIPLDRDMFDEIICGCPLLQDLSIANCDKLKNLSFSAANIKRLEVIKDEKFAPKMTIDCPNLRSFVFIGFVEYVEVKNLSCIFDATLVLGDHNSSGFISYDGFHNLLEGIQHAEVLTILLEFMLKFDPKLSETKICEMIFLKDLVLKDVNLSSEMLTEIIQASPSLEDVSFINCTGLDDISFSSPSPSKLTVVHDNVSGSKININCPNITSLKFSGFFDSVEKINLPCIVNADLDLLCRTRNAREGSALWKFLSQIRHVKVLALSENTSEAIVYVMGVDIPCPTNNWKHIILNTRLTERHVSMVCGMLRMSICLEELTINVNDRHKDSPEDRNFEPGDKRLHEGMSCSPKELQYTCLKQHLKRVTVNGHSTRSHAVVVQVTNIILKSALVLENLVLCPREN